jgi:hypothetical protein
MSFLEKLEKISAQLEDFCDQTLVFVMETISIEVAAILSTIIPCQNITLGIPFVSMSTPAYVLNLFIAGAMGAILKSMLDSAKYKYRPENRDGK